MIAGVDVSGSQGVLTPAHWAQLAAQGVAFAFLEGSVGNEQEFDGTTLERNIAGATAAGIPFGIYDFAYPLPESDEHPFRDPVGQLELWYKRSKGRGVLRNVIDLEWPPPSEWAQWGCSAAQIRDWIAKAVEYSPTLWGCAPILYGERWWLEAVGVAQLPELAKCGIWVADWRDSGGAPPGGPPISWTPHIPAPWTSAVAWQWTGGKAKMPNGAPGDFDLALSLDAFRRPAASAGDPWLVPPL